MLKRLCSLLIFPAFLFCGGASAEDIDWNDELTQSVLEANGIHTAEVPEGRLERLLQAETLVQSERLSRSGALIIERKKTLSNAGSLEGAAEYVAVATVPRPDGKELYLLRQMTPEEVQRLRMETAESNPEQMAAMMEAYSDGLVLVGAGIEQELQETEFGALFGSDGFGNKALTESHSETCQATFRPYEDVNPDMDEQYLFGRPNEAGKAFSPLMFMLGPSCMLSATAERMKNAELPPSDEEVAAAAAATQVLAAAKFSIVGAESLNGQNTQHIKASGLDIVEVADDGTKTTIENMHVWIDTDSFVRPKIRMEGTMEQGREKRRFFMERENRDYQRVGNSYLYEPYREIMRVGGVLNAKQRAELAEAKEKLADFDKQLAAMPASQRAMMEKMMGSQIEQMRSMVDDGTIEIEVITTSIVINPDMSQPGGMFPGKATPDGNLLQTVQRYLTALGYNPGNVSGEQSAATTAAISRYQAARGLSVTGEASPELAARLKADVDAQ